MKSLLTIAASVVALTAGASAQSIGLEYMTADMTANDDDLALTFFNVTYALPSVGPLGYTAYAGVATDVEINGAALGAGESASDYLVGVKASYDVFSTPGFSGYLTADAAALLHSYEFSAPGVTTTDFSFATQFGAGVGAEFSFGAGTAYADIGYLGGGANMRIGANFSL